MENLSQLPRTTTFDVKEDSKNDCSIIEINEEATLYKVASRNATYIVHRNTPDSKVLFCNCKAGEFGNHCKHKGTVVLYWKETGYYETLQKM